MKQYKVFLSPTESIYILLLKMRNIIQTKKNPGVTLLVFTIDKKIIASFNIANILGDQVIEEISVKAIINKGV